jgi:hypothetical protein
MPVTSTSALTTDEAEECHARAGLLDWFKPWVRPERNIMSWEEGEGVHSQKQLIRVRPGVRLDLLEEEDNERARFQAELSHLHERGYYQLKVWPRTTREFCEDQITLLATLPGGREKLYKIRTCVD